MFDPNSPEYKNSLTRAEKLSAQHLKELTELVGITFSSEPVGKQDYLDVLDEADDNSKVFKYLSDNEV